MNDLKNILTDEELQDLEDSLEKVLNEGEKTLATAIVRSTANEITHEISVLARLFVKKIFWEHVAKFSDDKLSKTEDMKQARMKANNAVQNITRSAALEKELRDVEKILNRFVKGKAQDLKKELEKSDYANTGF